MVTISVMSTKWSRNDMPETFFLIMSIRQHPVVINNPHPAMLDFFLMGIDNHGTMQIIEGKGYVKIQV